MRGALILFGFLTSLSAPSVWGQETFSVLQTIFLPPIHYVGDVVEARVRVLPPESVIPAEPAELPDSKWITYHGARVVPIGEEYDLRLTFTSFHPGTTTLPSVTFGELTLDGVKTHTNSIVKDRAAEFEPIRDQVLLPGTRLLASLVIGAVLVGPLLLIGLIVLIRGGYRKMAQHRRAMRPLRRLTRRIAELRSGEGRVDNREIYTQLVAAFKAYLTARIGTDFSSATCREMGDELRSRFPGVHDAHDLTELVIRFDDVRFGGRRTNATRRERDLDTVLAASKDFESAIETEQAANADL